MRNQETEARREAQRDLLEGFLLVGSGSESPMGHLGGLVVNSILMGKKEDPIEQYEADALRFVLNHDVMPINATGDWSMFERSGFKVGPVLTTENKFHISMREFVLPAGWSKVPYTDREIEIKDQTFVVRAVFYMKAELYSGLLSATNHCDAQLRWCGDSAVKVKQKRGPKPKKEAIVE